MLPPSAVLAVYSKLHKSEPFHISNETNLYVHKHHGISLYIAKYVPRNSWPLFIWWIGIWDASIRLLSSSLAMHRKRTVLYTLRRVFPWIHVTWWELPRGTSARFLFDKTLRRGYYCLHTINAFSIHVMKQVTSTHPFYLPAIITQTSFKQASEIVEGEEREFSKLLHIPSEQKAEILILFISLV